MEPKWLEQGRAPPHDACSIVWHAVDHVPHADGTRLITVIMILMTQQIHGPAGGLASRRTLQRHTDSDTQMRAPSAPKLPLGGRACRTPSRGRWRGAARAMAARRRRGGPAGPAPAGGRGRAPGASACLAARARPCQAASYQCLVLVPVYHCTSAPFQCTTRARAGGEFGRLRLRPGQLVNPGRPPCGPTEPPSGSAPTGDCVPAWRRGSEASLGVRSEAPKRAGELGALRVRVAGFRGTNRGPGPEITRTPADGPGRAKGWGGPGLADARGRGCRAGDPCPRRAAGGARRRCGGAPAAH
jgi:hypothetical protein